MLTTPTPTNTDLDHQPTTTLPEHPQLTGPASRRRTGRGPAAATPLPLAQAEAAEAVAILAPLVPSSAGLPLVRLARLAAAKLAGHGADCAAAINPPRGSLTIDDVRTRRRALFDALTVAERPAALALVTLDVQETLR